MWNFNMFELKPMKRIQKGLKRMKRNETKGERGTQSEVKKMCGQRAAGHGWPYQFEICHHSVS